MNIYSRSKKARELRKSSIIVMRDQMKMTLREVGDVLGISGERVRHLYFRATRDRGKLNGE
jgi:DNA-directed RNA polymerase sigma subunit (sigma70/sigma32)